MPVRIILFFFGAILLLNQGCSKPKKITGREFIEKEVLVSVLVDIHLVDGITNDRKFHRRYTDADSIDVLGPILEKHQVDRQMFDTTLLVYTRHPDLFDEVYNDVLSRLNMMLDELDEGEEDVEEVFGVSKPEG